MGNLGNDIKLDIDGDFIFGLNGDFFTTDDEEATIDPNDLPFEGYIAIRQFIFICLEAVMGEYNPFDTDFGVGIENLISKNIPEVFNDFKERVITQLLNDDRIKDVARVDYEMIETNLCNIYIDVIVQGENYPSGFVYPFATF
jgi:hypothetical protein